MIYILLLIFLFGIIIYSKKWEIKKKIFVSLCMAISLIFCYGLFILKFWNLSIDQTEKKQYSNEYQEQNFKSIFLKNDYKKKIYVIINFIYSTKEIKENNIKIIDYHNKIDSVLLKPTEKTMIFLPIYKDDSIKFPESFSVTVKDSVFSTIKIYKEELFLKESISIPITKELKEGYKSNSWELHLKN